MFCTTFDKEKKQWNGPKIKSIFNAETSLGNIILNVLQTNGSRVAQICANTNATTTFDELYAQTIRVAKNLQKIGCHRDEVIFFFTNNCADVPAIIFAALCLGCPVTALGTFNKKRENLHYLNITKPKYVICDLEYYDMLKECFKHLNYELLVFTFDGQIDDTHSVECLLRTVDETVNFTVADIDGTKGIAFIPQSSGSTGMSKCVCLSHASVFDSTEIYSSVMRTTDVVLNYSDINAISGIRWLICSTLNGSTRVVNPGPFSPERFFQIVEQCKVTLTYSGVYSIKQLLNHPRIGSANLSSLKHYFCAGSRLSLNVIHKMNGYMKNGKLCNTYGATETCGTVALNLIHQRNDCAGQLTNGIKAKIVNDRGERLGVGDEGEICLKQPYPFLGYLSGNENVQHSFDDEGFYMTGDIGRFDENGDLFIVDRKKEMFKFCSKRVIPSELEEFLDGIEGIRHSCVVPIPDSEHDFLPAAVIVKSDGSACTEQSIYDAVSTNFACYKRLEGGVYFVKSLPRTETGKVVRRLVAQIAFELYKNRKNNRNVIPA